MIKLDQTNCENVSVMESGAPIKAKSNREKERKKNKKKESRKRGKCSGAGGWS